MHGADRAQRLAAHAIVDGDGGMNFVAAARQALQHAAGVVEVARLADDLAVERERGVGSKNRAQRHVTHAQQREAVGGLGAGEAVDVGAHRFVGERGFVDTAFARRALWHQWQEVHADLVQQFAAAGAGRGEIKLVRHREKSHNCGKGF